VISSGRCQSHLFDLGGKTLRFTPAADGSYSVQMLASSDAVACDTLLRETDALGFWVIRSWGVSLPFPFPFAGKAWNKIYVNNTGSISFDKPETESYPQRDPWPNAGIRSVAAAIDARSAAGLEQMIAVLWSVYHPDPRSSAVCISAGNDSLAVTWSVRRFPWTWAPLDENVFQVRLFRSGMIEMAYPRVAEREGIVGLFTGRGVSGARLDHVEFTGRAPHPSVDIAAADIYDAGSVLKFTYTMKNDVPATVPSGDLMYRFLVNVFGSDDELSVHVTDRPRGLISLLGAPPWTVAFQLEGRTATMYVSKVAFGDRKRFTYMGDVVWWGFPERFAQIAWGNSRRVVDLTGTQASEVDFSGPVDPRAGNIFEVFHYPQVSKMPFELLQPIYRQFPPRDDFAIVLTDFRIDDLFGESATPWGRNIPIKGIGEAFENPGSTAWIGSTQLQGTMETLWVGSETFAESGTFADRRFRNFAHGVALIAHELTHRWGPALRFRNPLTGQEQPLTDAHWLESLHTPAYVPLGDRYLEGEPLGHSIMAGSLWLENPDGSFSKGETFGEVPGGLSALDLYVMGLLPPEQVPDTFILQDLRPVGPNRYRATKVPIRIQEIIAAMGPRVPSSAQAQKEFRLTLYLVHEPGRGPDPAMLARANGVALAVADFFDRATGGRMKILPSAGP
jgi:hypothetical protein